MHVIIEPHTELGQGPIRALPLFAESVPAGFPSPAEDYLEKRIDLNERLIPRPASTYLVRASGESMIRTGIFDGDLLIVDRSIEPKHHQVVIAAVDGSLTVKRLDLSGPKPRLLAENRHYAPLELAEGAELEIWGVVTYVLHKLS